MSRIHIVLFCLAVFAWSCQSNTEKQQGEDQAEAVQTAAEEIHFGETIAAEGAISLTELQEKMSEADSMRIKVTASVTEVCQKKGCWMNLASDPGGEGEVMVRFKDYGFFMPKDLAGERVVVDGWAYRQTVPVAELQHYAEDAGKSEAEIAAITEPEERLTFLASGVLLLDRGQQQ